MVYMKHNLNKAQKKPGERINQIMKQVSVSTESNQRTREVQPLGQVPYK